MKSVGVSFVEESTYHGTSSEIAIHVAATTDAGGVAQGVLGVEESGNNITMVSGWNWYTGSNPSKIGAKQYDFETAVFQELGHAAGLGQSTRPRHRPCIQRSPWDSRIVDCWLQISR